jgi:hypothetical protein
MLGVGFWVLALVVPAPAQPARVFFGDPAHPVVSGQAWLIGHRWGNYHGVLVATIQNGNLERRSNIVFPEYWNQSKEYKLLVATSDHPVSSPANPEVDFAYMLNVLPDYLKPFSTFYLSPVIQTGKESGWPTALADLGNMVAAGLVLPLPVERTITLLYPDGKPLAGALVPVSLYGSDYNHCGAAIGIELGTFKADRHGQFTIRATNAPLSLVILYFEEQKGGPAGIAFAAPRNLITGAESSIVLRRLWTLPEYEYTLQFRTPGVRLSSCLWEVGCGSGCGPLPIGDRASAVPVFCASRLRICGPSGQLRLTTPMEPVGN